MCLHTVILDPSDPARIYIAISAAGAFRTDDGGETWQSYQPGAELPADARSNGRSRPLRSPHCHASVAPWCACSCRSTGTSCAATMPVIPGTRSAETYPPTSVLRSTFTPMSRKPSTWFPIKSDSEHYPPEGKLRVYRSRSGGNEWEPLTNGLPQSDCYVNVLARRDGRRFARFLWCVFRHHRRPGLCIVRRRRQLGAHRPGSSGRAVSGGSDAVVNSRRILRLRRISERWRKSGAEVNLNVEGPVTHAFDHRRVGGCVSDARRHSARSLSPDGVGPLSASLPADRISRTNRRTPRCPKRSRPAPSPS